MSKWYKIGVAGFLVFGVLAVLMTGIAFAQDDTTPAPEITLPRPEGRGFGRGLGGQVGLEAAAQALGMTAEELSAELWAGRSLADIAEEHGVDLVELQATVQAAVQAEMKSAMTDAINQAVEDGVITQENADWLQEGLDNGFISGFGFDRGGHGGFRGHGLRGGGGTFAPPGDALQVSPSGGA